MKAISGADVVEKRSNLVQLMRTLFEKVLDWGDKLVYTGTKDEGLPPGVLHALDGYLAESNSKLLVVMPLKDERETESKKKPRSAIMMESFESNATGELAVGKLEVVGRHAASALYNSAEYRRIPMRFLWLPLAKIQDGLGGKAKAITTLVMVGLGALIAAMIFVPYPLKMEANGQLLPIQRQQVYAPVEGFIIKIREGLKSGSHVAKGEELLLMRDTDLAGKIFQLQSEIQAAEATVNRAANRQSKDDSEQSFIKEFNEAQVVLNQKSQLLETLRKRTNSTNTPGEFIVPSPLEGIVLSSDFQESLLHRNVKPNEPLLRVGYTNVNNPKLSDWEAELKIPQKHIGQVLNAYRDKSPTTELDIDLLLSSMPTQTFKGKLLLSRIAKDANVDRNANNEPEPVVKAWVRLSPRNVPAGKDASGKETFVPDIPAAYQQYVNRTKYTPEDLPAANAFIAEMGVRLASASRYSSRVNYQKGQKYPVVVALPRMEYRRHGQEPPGPLGRPSWKMGADVCLVEAPRHGAQGRQGPCQHRHVPIGHGAPCSAKLSSASNCTSFAWCSLICASMKAWFVSHLALWETRCLLPTRPSWLLVGSAARCRQDAGPCGTGLLLAFALLGRALWEEGRARFYGRGGLVSYQSLLHSPLRVRAARRHHHPGSFDSR